jgi:hypothetical protein
MFPSFWESIGEGLSQKWLERLFGPAFLFWAGGLLLWIGPTSLPARWAQVNEWSVVTQSALLIGALLALAASDRLVTSFRPFALRLLEGYWPAPLQGLAAWRAAQRRKRTLARKRRWSDLMLKREGASLSWREQRELARLEAWRFHTPRDAEDLLPTRLGDILKTAETRPRQRYGLDPVLLWPHLWLTLPDNVRQDLSAARERLDTRVETWTWGLLFALWTFAWPWAWVIALLWMVTAYALALNAAETFADLLLAAFDTHRWRLYESLRWPLPDAREHEKASGEALTRFIQRGL